MKMSMSSVVYLLANTTITINLPNYGVYFTVIQNTNTQIQALQVKQETDKSGSTAAKNELRVVLISQAIDISRRVVAYASNIANIALQETVDYTESRLKKASDQKLVSSCQVIYENANTNLTALAPYGVTAATLATLQASITSFSTSIPKVRVRTTDSGKTTNELVKLFKVLADNWEKVDTLIEMVRISKPNFYSEYEKVRKVIEKGKSSLSLKIQAINAINGEGEANVKFTLTLISKLKKAATDENSSIVDEFEEGKKVIERKTAKGGSCNVKNLPDGTYLLTGKKTGCKDVSETINIVNGELKSIKIKIEKE